VLPILALFLPQLMIQVYVLVNRIVLGNISGEIEVGYYNQANKVIRIALGVISSLGTVLLPRMASEFSKGNQEQFHKYIDSTLQFVLFITIPMTFGLIAIAPNFVVWFLGGEFLKVSPLLMIMSPVLFFVGLANVFGIQILISSNQQNKYSVAITIGAIVSLITNILLVHAMGSVATTIALLVAEALGAIIQMYFARKYFSFTYFGKLFLRYSILGLLIFLSARMVGYVVTVPPVLLTMLQLGIGGAVYLIGLIVIKDSLIFKLLGIMNQKKMVYSAKR
jgi:O-antigen/teichoic acid export membrane protein